MFEILSVCSGRDHRDLDDCRRDRERSGRTFQAGMQWRTAGGGFLVPRGMRTCSQGKKADDTRCGRTIEAKPVCDQTCQIEAAVAASDEHRIEWISNMAAIGAPRRRSGKTPSEVTRACGLHERPPDAVDFMPHDAPHASTARCA